MPELESYAALVTQYFSETGHAAIGRPEIIALSLLAVVQGLGSLSLMAVDRGAGDRLAKARNLVFNRLIAAGSALLKTK